MSEIVQHDYDELAAAICADDWDWNTIVATRLGDKYRTYAKRAATALGCSSDATLAEQIAAAHRAMRTGIRRR